MPGALGVALTAVMFALADVDVRVTPRTWLALASVASAIYLSALWTLARRPPPSRRWVWAGLVLAVACRAPLLVAPPTLSDDIYRYLWDGRVQRAGLSPFVAAPADPALAHLHSPATRLTNHPALPTIYPPAAQWFFRGVAALSVSVRAFKVAFVLCDLALAGLVLKWLAATGRPAWRVLAYAWNPLVIVEVAGSGHVDALGAMLLFASFLALSMRMTMVAATAFVTAVSVKFLPIVLVPLFWRRVRVRDVAVASLVGVAMALPFFADASSLPLGSLPTYLRSWRFNGPVYGLAERVASGRWLPLLPALAGVAVAVASRRRASEPAAWAWPMAASLVCMPAVFPWYLLWLVPFLAGAGVLPLLVWTQAALLTYAAWFTFPATGRYQAPAWVVAIEYLSVMAVAVWTMRRRGRGALPVVSRGV